MTYDSTKDVLEHKRRVQKYLNEFAIELIRRGNVHDDSKLQEPEKSIFDRVKPVLDNIEYGTDEYMGKLAELKPALDHHYANNSHHPEHYEGDEMVDGLTLMNLFDIVEMLMDWKAASENAQNGDIYSSLAFNQDRFNIPFKLGAILKNTANKMGW